MIFLEIAIPTYNREKSLFRLLESISACKKVSGLKLLVTVIDNGALNCDFSIFSKSFELKYIKNDSNIGAVLNINKCFQVCEGDYLIVLGDDDLVVKGDFLKTVYNLLIGDPKIVLLNYFNLNHDGSIRQINYGIEKEVNLEGYYKDFLLECGWIGNCIYPKVIFKDFIIDNYDTTKNGAFPHLLYQIKAISKINFIYLSEPLVGNTYESFESLSWKKDSLNYVLSFLKLMRSLITFIPSEYANHTKNLKINFLKRINHFHLRDLNRLQNTTVYWANYKELFFVLENDKKLKYFIFYFYIKLKFFFFRRK